MKKNRKGCYRLQFWTSNTGWVNGAPYPKRELSNPKSPHEALGLTPQKPAGQEKPTALQIPQRLPPSCAPFSPLQNATFPLRALLMPYSLAGLALPGYLAWALEAEHLRYRRIGLPALRPPHLPRWPAADNPTSPPWRWAEANGWILTFTDKGCCSRERMKTGGSALTWERSWGRVLCSLSVSQR